MNHGLAANPLLFDFVTDSRDTQGRRHCGVCGRAVSVRVQGRDYKGRKSKERTCGGFKKPKDVEDIFRIGCKLPRLIYGYGNIKENKRRKKS